MRLYALYSLNKRMLAVVITSFVISLSVSGYILSSILSKISGMFKMHYRTLLDYSPATETFGYLASAENSPLGGMLCFAHYVLPTFYLFWIPLMVFESLLLTLAVCRGLQTLRHSGTLGRKLVIILIRDSVVYFLG